MGVLDLIEVNNPELVFDAEKHEYTVDGVRLPSITEVLTWRVKDFYRNDEKRDLGTDYHKLFAEWAKHTMVGFNGDLSQLNLSFWAAIAKTKYAVCSSFTTIVETPMFRVEPLGFAGTPDVVQVETKVVIDFKTGQPARWHQRQTAAQAVLAFPGEFMQANRYSIYHEPGTVKFGVQKHTDIIDFHDFFRELKEYKAR
jgi:hypothetical protein